MMLVTQYLDVLKEFAASGKATMVVPHGPSAVQDIEMQVYCHIYIHMYMYMYIYIYIYIYEKQPWSCLMGHVDVCTSLCVCALVCVCVCVSVCMSVCLSIIL